MYPNIEAPAFEAIDSPIDYSQGYLWLKLKDKYLNQWDKNCLRRHIEGEGCSLLSSTNMHKKIRKVLTESQEIRQAVELLYQRHGRDAIITTERNGPALTIKIQVVNSETFKCYDYNYTSRKKMTRCFMLISRLLYIVHFGQSKL